MRIPLTLFELSQGGRSGVPKPLILWWLLSVFSGCLRTQEIALPNHPRTIVIPMVENQTFEYGAEERVTDVFVQEFLRDGRLRVVPRDQADLELKLTLVRYDLRPVSYNKDEQARVFELRTRLLATLTDLRSGQVLLDREAFDDSGVFFLSNQPGAKREEQVYSRIAEAIISRVLEGW